MRFAFLLAVFVTLVACTLAAEHQWGEIGPKDSLIATDKVKKRAIFALKVSKKYVLKQKGLDAHTISAIRAEDMKKNADSTAEILSGGPGSKGVTIRFTSRRNKRIRVKVKTFARVL